MIKEEGSDDGIEVGWLGAAVIEVSGESSTQNSAQKRK